MQPAVNKVIVYVHKGVCLYMSKTYKKEIL